MSVDLKERYIAMRRDGEERVVYGKGYVVMHQEMKSCSITFSSHTTLDNIGMLRHDEPRSSVEFSHLKGEGLGEGTTEELLTAAHDGRFETDHIDALTAAIKNGLVLYLKPSQSLIIVTRKDAPEQYIDHQLFYPSTQRAQAITDMVEEMRKCHTKMFGKDGIKREDTMAIVSFISTLLP